MSKKRKAVLCAILCVVIVIIAAIVMQNQDRSTAPDNYLGGDDMYRNRLITASEAKELMTRYPNAIILDVRTEQEFQAGHIPGAVLLPDFDIPYLAASVLGDYSALILVYCRSGNRSRSAVKLLVSMGYKNAYDFGGINTWPYGLQ